MSEASLGTVTAKTTADNSQFNAAMKESAAVVTATARENTKAKKLEAEAIALAAKLAGASVTEQSMLIVKAYKAESAATADLRNARKLAKFTDEETGIKLVAAAYQQSTEAKLASAAASRVENAATEATILTQRSAVSAVVRASEGQQGIRAVEGFLTMIPGVGAAMQTIFPLVGGAMFVGLLVKMGEEFYKNEQRAKHMGEEVGRAWGEMNTKGQMANHEMELQNSKMQDQIDKIKGNPGDGLKTALLEAAVAADHLQERMAAAMKESEALLGQEHVSAIWAMLSGTAPTGESEGAIKKALQDARNAMAEAGAKRSSDMKAAGSDPVKQAAANSGYSVAVKRGMDASAAQMRVQATAAAKKQADSDAAIDAYNAMPGGSMPHGVHRQPLAKQDMSAPRGQLEQQAVQFDNMGRMAEDFASQFDMEKQLNYLHGEGKPGKSGKESTEVRDMIREAEEAMRADARLHESLMATWKESEHHDAEADKIAAEGALKLVEAEKKAYEAEVQTAKAAAKVDDANTKNAASMQELTARDDLATASISRWTYATQMAAIHAAAYRAELAALAEEYGALTPDDQQGAKGLDLQAKAVAVSGELERTGKTDAAAVGDATALGGAINALQEFTRSATDASQAVKGWLSGSLNTVNGEIVKSLTTPHGRRGADWGAAGHQIFTSATGSLLKGAEGSLLKGLGIGKADGSTAANALWVRMAAAVAGIGGVASKTVSSGLSGVLGIAHLLGVPGLDTGTNFVPQDMLAMVHKGEAIVPKAYNSNGGGGDQHTWNIDASNSTDPAQVHAQIMRAAPFIAAAAVSRVRQDRQRTSGMGR